jgi:hypothetical protein
VKRLFIGGPWDGRVVDMNRFMDVDPQYGCVRVPYPPGDQSAQHAADIVVYYPRKLYWSTNETAVSITVMADSLSGDLGRPVMAALVKLAGIDVVWEHDPNDPG